MNRNWKWLSLLLVAILVLTLTGCGQKTQSIVGKWNSEEFASSMGGDSMETMFGENPAFTFEFTKEGKMMFLVNDKPIQDALKEAIDKMELPEEAKASMPDSLFPDISYKLDGSKITMDMKMGEQAESATGDFKLEGDKLTITIDGKPMVFTKVK